MARHVSFLWDSMKGLQRHKNKDRVFSCFENVGVASFFSVFDGVGVSRNSLPCIRIAQRSLYNSMCLLNRKREKRSLDEMLRESNREVLSSGVSDGYSTIAALLVPKCDDDAIVISHLGDSQVYYIHKQFVEQMTNDHAIPNSSVVTQYLGKQVVDPSVLRVDTDGLYLLCSDGFSKCMNRDIGLFHGIFLYRNFFSIKKEVRKIVSKANDDDASYILVRVENVQK